MESLLVMFRPAIWPSSGEINTTHVNEGNIKTTQASHLRQKVVQLLEEVL